MEKPEALTTFSRYLVQKYNVYNNSHLQSAGGGQLTPAEGGQGQRLMQYKYFSRYTYFDKVEIAVK